MPSDLIQPTITSPLSAIAATPSEKGTKKSSSSASVIAVTASDRRPPRRASMASSTGQVATTIMVAQMIAGRNGLMIHSELTMSPPIKITPSVMRARSRCVSGISGASDSE